MKREKREKGFEGMQKCGEVKSAPYVEGLGVRVLTSSNKVFKAYNLRPCSI